MLLQRQSAVLNDKLKKCLLEGKLNGERHKGLKKCSPDYERWNGHLKKALHNFEAMQEFHDLNKSDWSASATFYALYHGLLAILAQKGFESRNQSCTFALIEDFIRKEEITQLSVEDIKEIFEKDITDDIEHSHKILDIRERMQYSTQTSLKEEEFKLLNKQAKTLLDKIRLELERQADGSR